MLNRGEGSKIFSNSLIEGRQRGRVGSTLSCGLGGPRFEPRFRQTKKVTYVEASRPVLSFVSFVPSSICEARRSLT